jgi:hypothetical protein
MKSAFAETILNDQNCFKTTEQWEALLELIPDRGEFRMRLAQPVLQVRANLIRAFAALCDKLRKSWSAGGEKSSVSRWKELISETSSAAASAAKNASARGEQKIIDRVRILPLPRWYNSRFHCLMPDHYDVS